jgi:dihydroorotase
LELMQLLTLNPAQILRLPVGRLAVGAPADLMLFHPDQPWQICPDAFLSKSKNAPFDDRPVRGRVRLTIVDGRTIVRAEGQGSA